MLLSPVWCFLSYSPSVLGFFLTVLCDIQLLLPGVSLSVDALQLHCLRLQLVTDVLVLLSTLSELGIAVHEPVVNQL